MVVVVMVVVQPGAAHTVCVFGFVGGVVEAVVEGEGNAG